MKDKQAFTLIELLVVVLIIGVLAAIALPQYQKATEKAKAAEAFVVLKSVVRAAEAYHLTSGTWPTKFEELVVDIPWTETTKGFSGSSIKDTRSNKDWSLQIRLQQTSPQNDHTIQLTRLTGKYKGAYIFFHFTNSHAGTTLHLRCSEYNVTDKIVSFNGNPGDYCYRVLHAKPVTTPLTNSTAYKIEF